MSVSPTLPTSAASQVNVTIPAGPTLPTSVILEAAPVTLPPLTPPPTLRQRIQALILKLYPQGRNPERRREARFPFPYLIRLTPVGRDGQAPLGPTVVVVGKHISEHGLGFYYPAPLPYRRVLAEISTSDSSASLAVLMDLTWCRFTRERWYDGGGKFLEQVSLPDLAVPPRDQAAGDTGEANTQN
ncbi:MAG: hypothetical protein K8T25_05230 [Planctomycetia bacterium]|nr:hypothetical protein [Planctomycetia bacterium]